MLSQVLQSFTLPFCFTSKYLTHWTLGAGLFFLRTFSDLCSHGNIIIRLYLPLLTSQQPDSAQLCTEESGALHVSFIPQSYAQQSCCFWVSSAVYKRNSLSKTCLSFTASHRVILPSILFIAS